MSGGGAGRLEAVTSSGAATVHAEGQGTERAGKKEEGRDHFSLMTGLK